jgi:hypothetical protein
MMKISPVNPVVHKCIKTYLTKDQFGSTHFYDYDNCEYYIIRETANPDVIKFGFSCNCLESILKNGGQEMLDELYKGLVLPKDQGHPDAQITIAIDASGIQQTQKVKKEMSAEEADAVRA